MLRAILIIHRYIGVVLGVLMTLWCLSGFVMMYQAMPELSEQERLGALEPLDLAGCCRVPAAGLEGDADVSDLRIEMLAGRPVLILPPAEHPARLFDLLTGEPRPEVAPVDQAAAAARFGLSRRIDAAPKDLGLVEIDQWTLQTARRHQPLRRYRFADSAATEVYVSGVTGEVVVDTTRRERLLAWLGAIPHWLYPTALRQNGPLWTQVVVWSSTVGVFLTLTGLYVGVMRLRRLPNGRWSPFKGWWFWHHMLGLVFGVLTLTWVFSGLLTMTPFGLLDGAGGKIEEEITGQLRASDISRALATAPRLADGQAVQITTSVLAGYPSLLTVGPEGETRRHDIDGAATPLQESEVRLALAGQPTAAFTLLETEDAYYYGHHKPVSLPVWRAILADGQKTRVYVDATSGRVLRTVDGDARASRWLSTALHDFDWPVIRARPVWDLVVIPLLLGVTALCLTGTWLGFLRLGKDAKALRVRLRRRRGGAQPAE